MTEASKKELSKHLARVITMNLICLVLLIAFCAVMTFGSPLAMVAYWNEHRATSVLSIMVAILVIPGLVELAVSRWGLWRI